MTFKTLLSTAAIGIAAATSGYAATVDFEDVTNAFTTPSGTQVSNSFQFEVTATNDVVSVYANGGPCSGGCVDNGTNALLVFNNDAAAPFQVLMSAVDGRAFNLLSFDFTELFKFTTSVGAEIEVVGTLATGGTVTHKALFDQTPDSFQTEAVVGLSNVTNVLFNSTTYFPAYDNFVVSEVPLPAGGLLMLSGMLGFAGVKRLKKRTSLRCARSFAAKALR